MDPGEHYETLCVCWMTNYINVTTFIVIYIYIYIYIYNYMQRRKLTLFHECVHGEMDTILYTQNIQPYGIL